MGLKTVKVPKEFEGLFAKAEEVVSTYFGRRKSDPTKGTIEIFDERYVLVRAASLSVEFFDLVENLLGKDSKGEARALAMNVLFDLAHAIGKSDARNFHEKMKLKDPIAKLSVGPVHFSHTGWASVSIFPESKPSPDENYYLIYDHPYSFESDAWIRSGRKTDFPMCIMNAGYSSGWCEESFGVDLVASEILCRAKGDDCCRFIMAPPQRIEEHIQRYSAENPGLAGRIAGFKRYDFFERQKRMEQGLKEREEQYRSLVANIPDVIWTSDSRGHTTFITQKVEDVYGFTPEEILKGGDSLWFGRIHPDDIENVKVAFEAMLTEGKLYDVEYRIQRKDGEWIWLHDRAMRAYDKDGTMYADGLFSDITDRKKAEEDLRESEERFRVASDLSTDLIYEWDINSNIVTIYGDVSAKLGHSDIEQKVKHDKWEAIIHPDDKDRIRGAAERHLNTGEPFNEEYRIQKEDGSLIEIIDQGLAFWDENGKPYKWIGVITDITAKKRAHEVLLKSKQHAEEWSELLEKKVQDRTEELRVSHQRLVETEKLAILGQVSSTMSHELRTPLTGIKNASYLMNILRLEEHNPKVADYLSLINSQVDVCARVLDNMLDFVRPKAPMRKETNMGKLINDSLKTLYMPSEVKVSTKIGKDIQTLYIDPFQMQQVFGNIIRNAIDAMSAGGDLEIAMSTEENYAVISFKDNGMGISPENISKVFDPLFSTSPTGIGLGLAVSRQIVEANGGRIDVESKAGQGATFKIKLPVK